MRHLAPRPSLLLVAMAGAYPSGAPFEISPLTLKYFTRVEVTGSDRPSSLPRQGIEYSSKIL